jgi:putative transposase
VWGTKFRRKWLKEYVKNYLVESFYATVENHPSLHIETLNTNEDHVHLVIEIPPDVAVCEVVQRLKADSSQKLKKRFAFIRRMYLTNSIWSVGYFSSTIGINEDQIKRYVEHQGKEELPKQVRLGF